MMIATGVFLYLMVGGGVALGMHCIMDANKPEITVGISAFILAVRTTLLWPVAVSSLLTLALFEISDR